MNQPVKPLTPRAHGYIDYAAVLALAVAPALLDFSTTPSAICYALATVHLAMTLLTAFPLGVTDLIPFRVHGAIEAVVALVILALPWVADFSTEEPARNFFVISAIALGVTWALTDYKAAYSPHSRGPRSRSPSFI
ncbi:MAG TPA: hypothetical protein VHQ87_01900 [Rhizobacter sp.]|nr:hypothetical protein [Rhizobacter sp.]